MGTPDEKDLSAFLSELETETDRGLALVGAAVIDDNLRAILEAFFSNRAAGDRLLNGGALGTFSARIDACFALALIEPFEHHEITTIRKIRNEFAHAKHGISFFAPAIDKLCSKLKSETSPLPAGKKFRPRSLFKNAVVQIVVRLYRRHEFVARERRAAKPWVEGYKVTWGSGHKLGRVEIVEINRDGQEGTAIMNAAIKGRPNSP